MSGFFGIGGLSRGGGGDGLGAKLAGRLLALITVIVLGLVFFGRYL